MPQILIVDDEPKIVRLVADYLAAAGFAVSTARSGEEALMRARTEPPDLVILDLGLPQMDGLDVTRALRRNGDLLLDVPRMRVTRAGEPVELTATEFALLAAMARQPGRVFTRGQLLDAIHGVAFESYERAIDAHVKNIRRKLEPAPHAPRYLLTVYGVGYRLAE
jgi:DNA-binding response OmpR family regulator